MTEEEVVAEIGERIHHVAYIGNVHLLDRLLGAHMAVALDPAVDRDKRREAWLSIATIAGKQATL